MNNATQPDSSLELKLENRWQSLLEEDLRQISEAIERLAEGVCCKLTPTDECAWDLFGKLQEALQDHIEFEEKWAFPGLPESERHERASEHRRLSCLAAKASWDFECGYGDDFRGVLTRLAVELKKHHERDRGSCLAVNPYTNTKGEANNERKH